MKIQQQINLLSITGPILEFKGSVRHVQKGHPTLAAQVYLTLQS